MLITFSELISQSFEKYFQNFKKVLPYLGIALIAFLLRYAIGYLGVFLAFNTRLSAILSDLIILLLLIIVAILGYWSYLALIKLCQNFYQGMPSSVFKINFFNSKKYLVPFFLISLVSTLLIALGGLFLFIPGLIFFVLYYFSNYIVIFEDKNSLGVLSDSKNLAVGRWFAVVFRIAVPKLVFSLLSGLLGKVILSLFILIFSPSAIAYDLAFEFIAGIVTILMLPLFIWQDIILYYNLKQTPIVLNQNNPTTAQQ